MTHVISLLNMKGGVGKTTTTVILGEFLAGELGRKVLLIDMDPQISLSITMLGERQWVLLNDGGHTLAQLFTDALNEGDEPRFDLDTALQRNVSNVKDVANVDLLPSSLDIIPQLPHLEAISAAARSADPPVWDMFREGIGPILDAYDYVLVDCPPNLGVMTASALRISEGYVIPTIPDVLSTYGISAVQREVKRFARTAGIPEPVEFGTIVTKHEKRSPVHRSQMARLKNDPAIPPLLHPSIPQNSKISGGVEGPFKSLKGKYGARDCYDVLFDLTEAFRQRIEEGE
ncbi:ParA family protein [Brooklawnia cerclae]|uniref:Chromosome partitioning protein n=1 Tax=Brooklawnia cerclae TaxID=349934 RepID=A0ABX0SAM8_9ACTN|nr:ParA family protein [Brooklawnia cerclae]NIH55457.1 chromosome partitioning protein [Brooklawnia cerclae]